MHTITKLRHYQLCKDMKKTLPYYDKAIEINPEFSWAFYNKAQALSTLQRYEEALPYYDKAIELDSENADAHYNKAQALSTLQRYEEASSLL